MKQLTKFFLGLSFSIWSILFSVLLVIQPLSVRIIHQLSDPTLQTKPLLKGQSQLVAQSILPFTSVEPIIQCPYFTTDEKSHLYDVKKLSTLALISWGLLSILLLGLFKFYGTQVRFIFYSSIKILVFIFITGGITALFWWESLFVLFHQVFFPQGNWSFPENSMLITLYPKQFWQIAAMMIGILSIVLALLSNLLVKTLLRSKSRVRLNESVFPE